MDENNKDHEIKFVDFITAAEELIQHLKSERENLQVQVKDIMGEMASIRSIADDQYHDNLKRLMEENHKNYILSKEVERLQQLQQERDLGSTYGAKHGSGKMNSEAEVLSEPVLSSNTQDHDKQRESSNALLEKTMLNETASDHGLATLSP